MTRSAPTRCCCAARSRTCWRAPPPTRWRAAAPGRGSSNSKGWATRPRSLHRSRWRPSPPSCSHPNPLPMKSHAAEQGDVAGGVPELVTVVEQGLPQQANALARARAFAEPLIAGETLDTGENTLAHADAVAAILKSMGGSEAMQAASYLVYAWAHLNKPQDVVAKAFGESYAALAA